jgi:hypothetical protein
MRSRPPLRSVKNTQAARKESVMSAYAELENGDNPAGNVRIAGSRQLRSAPPPPDPASAPPFPLGEQTNRAWREQALTRAAELQTLAAWFACEATETGAAATRNRRLDDAIYAHLRAATEAAAHDTKLRALFRSSAIVERTISNLDAAEADLLRRAPRPYVAGQLDDFWAHIRQHLPADDPRRIRVGKLVAAPPPEFAEQGREMVIRAVRAASLEARREYTRVRSFRNVVLLTALLMTLLAGVAAMLGSVWPSHLSLCFTPSAGSLVCPIGDSPGAADVLLVEFLGMVAAAVSGAGSLRKIRGSSTRLGLPVSLAVLKLPTGALAAYLGLLLVHGGFVPGLSALDTSGQILAWAVLFGAGQQLFTGLIDRQAHSVLDQVGGKANTGSPAPRT